MVELKLNYFFIIQKSSITMKIVFVNN